MTTPTSGPGDDRTPEQTVRSYLAAFATGDVDLIVDHVTEDFVNEHTAALGLGSVGQAAYRERLPTFLADMVDLRYEVEAVVADGDQVVAFYTMSARWQGDAPFSVRGVQRFVVANGRISHRTDYWDSAVFLTQVSTDAAEALARFGVS